MIRLIEGIDEDSSLEPGGFTLLELMIGATALVIALSGLLHAFGGCFTLNETSRNQTLALHGVQEKIEEIRNYNFSQIYASYNNTTFQTGQLPSSDHLGVVEVINNGTDIAGITNTTLLQVRVIICWRQKGGRVIGEDTNLNGTLDTGEDTDSDGRIDSPVELITLMTRKST